MVLDLHVIKTAPEVNRLPIQRYAKHRAMQVNEKVKV
jgi:hypothetical protein